MPTRDEPATSRQIRTISKLAQSLGIRSPIEENPMTFGSAGRLIRELEGRQKSYRQTIRKLKGVKS